MTELPIRGPQGPQSPRDASETARSKAAGAARGAQAGGEARPAFKALLDRLEQKARELEDRAAHVDGAPDLAGAMQGAKSSLEDALTLGQELLESLMQSRQQSAAPPDADTKS